MTSKVTLFYIEAFDEWNENEGSTYYLALRLGDYEIKRWEVNWNMVNSYGQEDWEQFVAVKLSELFSDTKRS